MAKRTVAKSSQKSKQKKSKPRRETTRFAHPFFTAVKPEKREKLKGAIRGELRMTDHIKSNLEKIPPVSGDGTMTLADIIGDDGATAIAAEKKIIFHSVGDTGHENGLAQEFVAAAMTEDFDIAHPESSPAFFLHLGDVIYYDNTDRGYHAQFYAPYKLYPGKIIAVPGNHDGELFKFDGTPTGQRQSLEAFQNNFCQSGSRADITSGTILRNMVSQPGVYWRLNAPFVDIVGLYSNVAENPGYLQGADIGDAQKKWLTKTLSTIKAERDAGPRKALMIAVHHPPISTGGSHSSSTEMLADIDDSCNAAKITPDVVLAAHSHDYQRYSRFLTFQGERLETPYLVAGSGGRGLSPHVTPATGQRSGDHSFEKSLRGYGYLRVTVSSKRIDLEFFQVDDKDGKRKLYDEVSVKL